MENRFKTLILAAGEGKRMKSSSSKVAHMIAGKPLVQWVVDASVGAGSDEAVVIVGHRQDQVRELMGESVKYALQQQQLGTGHAVMQAREWLEGYDGNVMILCGDTPLITAKTLISVMKQHIENGCASTIITAALDDPTGYGRVVRASKTEGTVLKIVEQRDATEEEKKINEINAGMYCFNAKLLLEALDGLSCNNSQNEYYLTDTIEILISKGQKVGAFTVSDKDEILGINDRVQLLEATNIMRKRINEAQMREGVTLIDSFSTYIDDGVKIGRDTVILPGTIIEGSTVIGECCSIGPNTRIVSSIINDNVEITNSVVTESEIGSDTHIGPFAYLRPGSRIGKKVKIGDFVEIKKATIGDSTKVSHLSYIGDADIGKNVNVGCGVVVVNYDGKNKNKTVVGDNSFVGCNVNLVSPVEVKENAYIAAGSTITDEVPAGALAVARSRQIVKEGWVDKKGFKRGETV